MEAPINHRGRDAGRRLKLALERDGVTRLVLSRGRYPVAMLTVEREIELVGMPGAILAGPLRVAATAKVRLVGLNIEGGIQVECFGVLHLQSCYVTAGDSPAALALAAESDCMLIGTVLNGGPGMALAIEDYAAAKIDRCRISGGKAAIACGTLARVAMGENRLHGPTIEVGRPPEVIDQRLLGRGPF